MRSRRLKRALVAVAVLASAAVAAGAAYTGVVAHRSARPLSLPAPAGPLTVGRQEQTWSDPARPGRLLSVWEWYPARAGTGPPAAYLPGAWSGLHLGFPVAWAETDFDRVRDPALEGARPAPGTYPVVVLEPGLGLAAPQYAVLAEGIASSGFVVLGVTPTGSANLTVVDGHARHATAAGNPADFSGTHTAHDEAAARALLPVWVDDARFVARRAARLPAGDPLAGHVDAAHVAYVGHSFGGAAALEACSEDRRCIAAADLDGGIYGDVVRRGLPVPVLLLGHDGSCITGRCEPRSADDRADVEVARRLLAASTGPTRAVDVAGTGHFDFTDYATYYLAYPLRRLLALGPRDGRSALRETIDLVDTLLERAAPRRGGRTGRNGDR